MDDLISRGAAIKAIERNTYRHTYIDQIVDVIKQLPSVQPRRIRGYWKPYTMSEITGYDPTLSGHDPVGVYCCSVCGCDAYLGEDGQDLLTDFCPNCGADMREDQ